MGAREGNEVNEGEKQKGSVNISSPVAQSSCRAADEGSNGMKMGFLTGRSVRSRRGGRSYFAPMGYAVVYAMLREGAQPTASSQAGRAAQIFARTCKSQAALLRKKIKRMLLLFTFNATQPESRFYKRSGICAAYQSTVLSYLPPLGDLPVKYPVSLSACHSGREITFRSQEFFVMCALQ